MRINSQPFAQKLVFAGPFSKTYLFSRFASKGNRPFAELAWFLLRAVQVQRGP